MVYVSFIILVVILLTISIYFISSLVYKRINEKKIQKKQKEILSCMEKILKSKEDLSHETCKLKNYFSNGNDIEAFYLAYLEYVEKYGYCEDLKKLLNEVVDCKKIIKSKTVKKSYRKSYTLYLIAEFQLDSKEAGEKGLMSLKDSSIYVRNNALNVIRNQGKVKNMMEALDEINNREKYYNDKILIDFLDNFKGDMEKLDHELLLKIDKYNKSLQRVILDHLINMRNDSLEIKDKMLELLETEKDLEILIKSTRYFSHIVDGRAEKHILKNMSSGNWILRSNSANAIQKYPSKEAKERLKKTLGDSNYFVRKNSANSFIKIQSKEEIFLEAIYHKDPFARDILTYTINTNGIKGFEEFKDLIEAESKEELKLEWA